MPHVVVLGGGVGGTLTANLIARKLKKRIAAHTADERRCERMHEGQPQEVEPWNAGDDAAILSGPPVIQVQWQVDPSEVGTETGTPDHVGRLDDLAVPDRAATPPAADLLAARPAALFARVMAELGGRRTSAR